MYSYNDEDHTAEVTNNDKGKYKGDVTIPATVSHNGKEYTVTMIKEEGFQRKQYYLYHHSCDYEDDRASFLRRY